MGERRTESGKQRTANSEQVVWLEISVIILKFVLLKSV